MATFQKIKIQSYRWKPGKKILITIAVIKAIYREIAEKEQDLEIPGKENQHIKVVPNPRVVQLLKAPYLQREFLRVHQDQKEIQSSLSFWQENENL